MSLLTLGLAKADITALYSSDKIRAVARGTRDSPILVDSDDDHRSETSNLTDSTDTSDTNPTPQEQQVVLSKEQKDILSRVKAKKNVFFTGSAGKCVDSESIANHEVYRNWKIAIATRNNQTEKRIFGYHCNYSFHGDCSYQHRWSHTALLGWN